MACAPSWGKGATTRRRARTPSTCSTWPSSGASADVELVPPAFRDAPRSAQRQNDDPMSLAFGLQIPSFTWPGGPAEMAVRLEDIAEAAEEVGFSSLWVMDHFLQIPPVGPEWHD